MSKRLFCHYWFCCVLLDGFSEEQLLTVRITELENKNSLKITEQNAFQIFINGKLIKTWLWYNRLAVTFSTKITAASFQAEIYFEWWNGS